MPSTPAKRVVLADDLTGACDSAVHFAAAGMRTVVTLQPDCIPAAEVAVFTTESRDVEPADSIVRVRQLAASLSAFEPGLIFKKIDSTLRGNTGLEIVAALEAFGCAAAIVNPAFPAMGRVVESGFLRVTTDDRFHPIALAEWLRSHGAEPCRHVRAGEIAHAIEGGARFIFSDAVCQEDLAHIAAEALATRRRILWAGSAGLARVLAAHQRGTRGASPLPPRNSGPVLFAIGSDHPVTMEQRRRLMETYGVKSDLSALRKGTHVLLPIGRGLITAEHLGPALSEIRPAAVFLSGGDTASAVCRALGAHGIELRCEFAPGIPAGVLQCGALDGTPVLTKSGGFGAPDDLVRIADYFHA